MNKKDNNLWKNIPEIKELVYQMYKEYKSKREQYENKQGQKDGHPKRIRFNEKGDICRDYYDKIITEQQKIGIICFECKHQLQNIIGNLIRNDYHISIEFDKRYEKEKANENAEENLDQPDHQQETQNQQQSQSINSNSSAPPFLQPPHMQINRNYSETRQDQSNNQFQEDRENRKQIDDQLKNQNQEKEKNFSPTQSNIKNQINHHSPSNSDKAQESQQQSGLLNLSSDSPFQPLQSPIYPISPSSSNYESSYISLPDNDDSMAQNADNQFRFPSETQSSENSTDINFSQNRFQLRTSSKTSLSENDSDVVEIQPQHQDNQTDINYSQNRSQLRTSSKTSLSESDSDVVEIQPEHQLNEQKSDKEENSNSSDAAKSEDELSEIKPQIKRRRGKICGKEHLFPPNFHYSSSSSSSPPSSPETNQKFNLTSVDIVQGIISKLPKPRYVDVSNMSNREMDENLYNQYKHVRICYECIHESYDYFKNAEGRTYEKEEDDDDNDKIVYILPKLLNFQKYVEERFLILIDNLTRLFLDGIIYTYDKSCTISNTFSKKYPVSGTALNYAKGEKRTSSQTDNNDNDDDDVGNDDDDDDDDGYVDIDNDDVNIVVNSHALKILNYKINKKLSMFYQCKYKKESHKSFDIFDIESFTTISYYSKVNSNLICELAYTKFDKSIGAYALKLKDFTIETGFYCPITRMHFHHDDKNNKNKLYLYGDMRIKEFTLDGLENINNKTYKDEVVIRKSNTFYFGHYELYYVSVMTVWDNKLAFGYNNLVYFCDLSDTGENEKSEDFQIDAELKLFNNINADKYDLTYNKCCEAKQIHLPSGMNKISALEVIKSSISDETFLAVSSLNYPIIYIYNKDYNNISRLVSHTMNITCLKSFNKHLFSGSFDLTARMWNIYKGAPELIYDTKNQQITTIETASFGNEVVLFTGGIDNTVQCFNVSIKKPLFEIVLDSNLVPEKISFVSGKTNKNEEHAKLLIVSKDTGYKKYRKDQCKYRIHFFEF